jgi:outer membrane immunogenic protein
MKNLLLASAALAVISAPAFAADAVIYDPAPTAPMVASVYDWSGAYIGIQGGYVWTDLEFPAGFGLADENFDGGTLGAHVGLNAQNGNLVYGVEADINYTWNENEYVLFGDTYEVGTDWSGSLRGRLGYAFDRTMIYGTAGLAITNGFVEGPGVDESETLTGYTVGAGVEHAFTDMISARLEYRYSDYGNEDFGLGLGDFDVNEHAVRVGVSFKF